MNHKIKVNKRLYKDSYQDFVKFLKSYRVYIRFKFVMFKYYGTLSPENYIALHDVFPPYYLSWFSWIEADKKVDWLDMSEKWQAKYYTLEAKL